MASIADTERKFGHMLRRNAFQVAPEKRPMPSKAVAEPADRIRPSVSQGIAEIAAHLSQNPVFVELFAKLRKEAVDKLTSSPLGKEGHEDRELARYELEALNVIESRIMAMGAEIRFHVGDETEGA